MGLRDLASRDTYTTGQISSLCDVSSRTVQNWIDHGQLPGYTVPSPSGKHENRRVHRMDLLAFLRQRRMWRQLAELGVPAGPVVVASPATTLVEDLARAGVGGKVEHADGLFALGALYARELPRAVVMDLALGRAPVLDVARRMGASRPLLVALIYDDEQTFPEPERAHGLFDVVVGGQPWPVEWLAGELRRRLA